MKELGEYLKETRQNNGVSLDEASLDLDIDSFLLESIEEGNTRAFRDVLGIKEIVRSYAKYLGLNSDEIVDEFNDFLFEHTSKISLNDILEAEKSADNKPLNKPVSPYTTVKVKKINVKKVMLCAVIVFAFIMLIIFIASRFVPKREKIINELMIEGEYYEKNEFTK